MKRLLLGLFMAAGLCFVGCDTSVEKEAKDVKDAQNQAVKDVKEEQRDVQDAAVEGAKNIEKEKRDLEDAKAREAERNAVPPAVTPPAP